MASQINTPEYKQPFDPKHSDGQDGFDGGGFKPPVDGGKGGGKDFCGAVYPKTLAMAENIAYEPVLSPTPLLAKVPVILAERSVQVDVESKIKLDHPAIEIKRIRKQLFLTQCKLLPSVGKLFLSGYVRKNIEYATSTCGKGDCISGDIKHTTCNIPFDCVTYIPYELGAYPVFCKNAESAPIQTFDAKLMGASPFEQEFDSVQNFNEKIFCELVNVRFNEVDLTFDDKKELCGWENEFEFTKITEKLTMFITIKLLQYQQIPIPGTEGTSKYPN
jgi:hypothetical protein